MVDGKKPVTVWTLSQVRGSCLLFFSISAGIKESVCWTPPPEVNPNKTCEYQALCSRFKDLLTLPGVPPVSSANVP